MRVCIVGGTGNISTSIVRVLLSLGHEVTCYNRGQRAAKIVVPAGVRTILGDRKERADFEACMQAEKFDAAIDMISYTQEDAESAIRAFRGVSHFVHCSTVCTYGVTADWYPVSEDHPLRPISDYGRNKVAADHALLAAWHREQFPVTIIKPSTTYGPQMGALRQIAWEFSWIDRVRKGKPLVVCGDGMAMHQFLHVDDAALGFAHCLGKPHCLGQVYNLVRQGFITWVDYHKTAMQVLGQEVKLIGVPLANLRTYGIPGFSLCEQIFGYNGYFDGARIRRDIPEFVPKVTLHQGLTEVIDAMNREGRIPDADKELWEDEIIAAQRTVKGTTKA
jgi:nucleoside-diphosphate-sugar epimerase